MAIKKPLMDQIPNQNGWGYLQAPHFRYMGVGCVCGKQTNSNKPIWFRKKRKLVKNCDFRDGHKVAGKLASMS